MAKVKHIALIKFKPETTAEQIENLFGEFLDLSENVPGIEDYVAGTNDSPQAMSHGFTHGVVMTFQDAESRNAYVTHPEHEKFVNFARQFTDNVLVLDFEIE